MKKNLFQIVFYLIAFTSSIVAQNSTKGAWGPVVGTDGVIPVAVANLPNGNILAWSAYAKNNYSTADQGKTFTTIINPDNNSKWTRVITNTGHDMFCPGISNLPSGELLITGGSSSNKTTIFNPANSSFRVGRPMNTTRGYQASVTLRDGRVFILGGSWSGGLGNKNAEVWSKEAGWTPYPGITANNTVRQGTNDPQGVYRDDNHAWLWAAPNGKVFQAGPGKEMHWIELDGVGTVTNAGNRGDDGYAMCGTTVMYDKGKILKAGGAGSYSAQGPASKKSYIIDISGNGNTNAQVTRVGNLVRARTFHNSVVLPNGEVVVTGGHPNAKIFDDTNAPLTAEIWNPTTRQWREGAAMGVARTYHSVSILLRDGRVWVGGGGLCGPCNVNHANAQIYTPPYLYGNNNQLAARPVITGAPAAANYHTNITVNTNSLVNNFVFIRLSSATHSTNNEQRRIPLTFTKQTNTRYTVNIPGRNYLPPGNYFLFASNASGVPSVAKVIKVGNTSVAQEVLNGDYYIQARVGGQQLFSASWDNNNVRMGDANTNADQKWRIKHLGGNVYTVRNLQNNGYLEVKHGNCGNGKNVTTYTQASSDHQKWIITRSGEDFFFRPVHCKGSALDKNAGSWGNAHLYGFSAGNANQKFSLKPVSSTANVNPVNAIVTGTYFIRSIVSGQNIVAAAWTGHNARMTDAGAWNDHRWVFTHVGGGQHTIKNAATNRHLGTVGCGRGSNAAALTGAPQKWYIEHYGNGYYLRPAACTHLALDKNGAYVNGNTHIYDFNANNRNQNQKWELIPGNINPRFSFVNVLEATPTEDRKASLKWTVNQEKEVASFIVQHSLGGYEDFEDIDEVEANTESGSQTYNYLHETPQIGENFYQIKIVYVDGTFDLTPFRNVPFEELELPITIFPNPADNDLNIDLSNYMDKEIHYFISDMRGKVISSGVFEKGHNSTTTVSLEALQNGSYVIYMRPEDHREITKRFVVMKRK